MNKLFSKLFGLGGQPEKQVEPQQASSAGDEAEKIVPLEAKAAAVGAAVGAAGASDAGVAAQDQELVAVITAAVAAFEANSASPFRIASIQLAGGEQAGGGPAGFNTPIWGRVDRLSQVPFQR